MLKDNPYGYNNAEGQGGSQSPDPSTSPVSGDYIPPQPPTPPSSQRVINPLNDSKPPFDPSLPSDGSTMLSPSDIDLSEQKLGRKPINKKAVIIVAVFLLLIGVVGGGAAAFMTGVIKNPFAKAPAPIILPPPPVEPIPPPPPPVEPILTNDDIRVGNIDGLATGLNSYFAQYQQYPTSNNELIRLSLASSPCVELLAANLIPLCFQDPVGEPAFYGYKSDGTYYEATSKIDDTTCIRSGTVFTGTVCLYKVVSLPQPTP